MAVSVPAGRYSTVILADGDFPKGKAALRVLRGAERIVCCDGAAASLLAAGFGPPAAVVGDLDSLPDDLHAKLAPVVVREAEQDDNDLAKAFRHCLSRGWRDLAVLGAAGGRSDHAIGNVSWLADFCDAAPDMAFFDDFGVFTAVRAPGGAVPTEKGMQVSFFSFDPRQELTAEGVLYPVGGLKARRWHVATLNEATGDEVRLSFSGDPVLVYRAFLES